MLRAYYRLVVGMVSINIMYILSTVCPKLKNWFDELIIQVNLLLYYLPGNLDSIDLGNVESKLRR